MDQKFNWAFFIFYSIKLRHYDARERGAVTLFRYRGCAGPSGAFFATEEPTEQALYNTKNLVE